MTEQALAVKKQDAPVEWGTRGEIAALADRFATMLPGAKGMTRDEVLTCAQYARMMDLNPFRGEVYFYQDRGRLCVVDGYKALARWARKEQPYTDRYDLLKLDDGEFVKIRCWILREDRKPFIREYTEMGASFQEAFEIAATYADGVVMESETTGNRKPPTGWTWEQVARKRAIKNALNLSHGAPSPREIAKQSWDVNGVQTIPADWDGTDTINGEAAERLAEMQARHRENQAEWREMSPDERQEKAEANGRLLHGDSEFEGFDTPPETTATPAPVWDQETFAAGEDEPEPEAETPTNGNRPLAAETVRSTIRTKAKWEDDHRLTIGDPISKGQRGGMNGLLSDAVKAQGMKQKDIDKARYDILDYLVGVRSSNDLYKAEATAIIEWLKVQAEGEWEINGYAKAETAAILNATAVEAGQQELDL